MGWARSSPAGQETSLSFALTVLQKYRNYDRAESPDAAVADAAFYSAERTCAQREDTAAIVNSLIKGTEYATYCGTEHLWRVYNCYGEVTLCVDCEKICIKQVLNSVTLEVITKGQRTCPAHAPFYRDKTLVPLVVNPCVTDDLCLSHVDSYATVSWDLGIDILYPEITSEGQDIEVSTEKNKMVVTVKVDKAGVIYCAALKANSVVTSSLQIKKFNFVTNAKLGATHIGTELEESFPKAFNVTISNLKPDTNYDVYCYTEDTASHFMPLKKVLQTKSSVVTDCCKSFSFDSFAGSVSADPAVTPFTYKFSLDVLPSVGTEVHVILESSGSCDHEEDNVATVAMAKPSSFYFSPTSPTSYGKFVVVGTPGCYSLTVAVADPNAPNTRRSLSMQSLSSSSSSGGESTEQQQQPRERELSHRDSVDVFDPVSRDMVIRSSLLNPDAPIMTSIRFDSNPSKVVITFDSSTDRGERSIVAAAKNPQGYLGSWRCTQIFEPFPGSDNARCIWTENNVITMTLGAPDTSTGRLPEIGDSIALIADKLHPICPVHVRSEGNPCPWNARIVQPLLKPLVPLKPIVAISTASEVGDCADIILDVSNSNGGGGREWKEVKWTFSVLEGAKEEDGLVDLDKIANINQDFNSNYHGTKHIVKILNEYQKSPAVYKIELTLTNFLMENSTGTVKIIKNQVAKQPSVSIVGARTVKKMRADYISLHAFGSVPVCPGTEVGPSAAPSKLLYTWNLWMTVGDRLILLDPANPRYAKYKNRARDPHYFKLPAYTLSVESVYTAEVIVTVDGNSARHSVDIEVSSTGVVAQILGGASRSACFTKDIVFTSDSFDLDYPRSYFDTSLLTYAWSCQERSPHFGGSCPQDLIDANKFESRIAANTFYKEWDAEYEITLTVGNALGYSATTSITVLLIGDEIPDIVMDPIGEKYNPDAKLQLSATVTTTGKAWARWISPDFDDSELDAMLLTHNKVELKSGVNFVSLSLKPDKLVGGFSYIFMLSATYKAANTDAIDKLESLTVVMNSAPAGGYVFVEPQEGLALSTVFYIAVDAPSFIDDDILPLVFMIEIYDDPSSVTILSQYSEKTSVDTILGQGLESRQFNRTIVACGKDQLGSSGCCSTSVRVKLLPADQLEAMASSLLETAFANSDPGAITNAVNAAASSINFLNCTLGSAVPGGDCSSISRASCESGSTPNTCGNCLSGLVGAFGPDNTRCSEPSAVKRDGQSCVQDSECASQYCKLSGAGRRCGEHEKVCKNGCSGHGDCLKFDVSDRSEVDSCEQGDDNCFVECVCSTDNGVHYNGEDCHLDDDAFVRSRRMHDLLCHSVDDTLEIQDLAEDVIAGRCSTVSRLLSDPTQLSAEGIEFCAHALIATIDMGADIVGDPKIADIVAAALAKAAMCPLPVALLEELNRVTNVLSESIQNHMVANEAPQTFISESTASSSQVNTGDVATGVAQTLTEIFNIKPRTEVSIEENPDCDAIGTTVWQYKNNPTGSVTDSITTGTMTTCMASNNGGNRRRRRMQELLDSNLTLDAAVSDNISTDFEFDEVASSEFLSRHKPRWRRMRNVESAVTMVLQNPKPHDYFVIDADSGNATCEMSGDGSNYNATVTCREYSTVSKSIVNASYAFLCDMQALHNYSYVCPETSYVPECALWNGTAFAVDPDCELISYTATNTTCKCSKDMTAIRRQLSLSGAAHTPMMEFSASASIVSKGFERTMGALSANVICSAGQYRNDNVAGACMACNLGTTTSGTSDVDHDASNDCDVCLPGYGKSGTVNNDCAICGAGKYRSGVAAGACTACNAGTTTSGPSAADHDASDDCALDLEGRPCSANSQCLSGFCDLSAQAGAVCKRSPKGSPCTADLNCASNACSSAGVCEDECSVGFALTACKRGVSAQPTTCTNQLQQVNMADPSAVARLVCACAWSDPVPLPAKCSLAEKTLLEVAMQSMAACQANILTRSGGGGSSGSVDRDRPPAGCTANCLAACSTNGSYQNTCDCMSQTCPSTCSTAKDNAWTLAVYSGLRTNRPFCLQLTSGEQTPPPTESGICNAGQYLKNIGEISEACQACPAGRFAPTNGNRKKKCPRCPRGTYQPEEGQTTCRICPEGFRSHGQMGGPNCFHKKTHRPMNPSDLLEQQENLGAGAGAGAGGN